MSRKLQFTNGFIFYSERQELSYYIIVLLVLLQNICKINVLKIYKVFLNYFIRDLKYLPSGQYYFFVILKRYYSTVVDSINLVIIDFNLIITVTCYFT